MPFARIKVVGEPLKDLPDFRKEVEATLSRYASDANAKLLEPTATWENHEVEFQNESRSEGNSISRIVYTNSDVYRWLDGGTRVRHVKLVGAGQGRHGNSSVGKTSVRSLNSGGGRTVGITISKKLFNFDGIKAREWTTLARDELQPQFEKDMGDLAVEAFGGKR